VLLLFDLSGGSSNRGLEVFKVNRQATKISIIAIVEDDDPLRDALESILRAAGFSVDKFPSAEAFLESPDRQRTSCLVLDVRLPGISGIELQQRLRDANFAVPIIFVTAQGDASVRDLVMGAGAAGFLTKPVRSETLLASIRAAIGRAAPV
jgi:FixJ family two-component response regulator